MLQQLVQLVDSTAECNVLVWNAQWSQLKTDAEAFLLEVEDGLPVEQEPKYTVKGGRIVNRASGETIPDDEPVFIFRARDKLAAGVLGDYANMCTNEEHAKAVTDRFIQFGDWSESHKDRMKEPDTEGPKTKTPRHIANVIDAMMEYIPEDQTDLRAQMSNIRSSSVYTAPEMQQGWWRAFQGVLEEHIKKDWETIEWQRKVIHVYMNTPEEG
jgi:hypothetical protein